MKIYTILFVFFLLILIPASVFAGDFAELEFIGVSENGKYTAFEEYGVQDGSGDTYSNIYFVDVEKNIYAASPVKIMVRFDKGNVETTRAKARKSAAADLKKFGIIERNTGRLVAARLLTDSAFEFSPYKDGGKTQTIGFKNRVYSMAFEGDYEVILNPVKVEGKQDYLETSVYKLDLTLKNNIKNTLKILQKDKSLPETRGLPAAYSVQRIYLYEDKIIVFISIFTSGFEGPDMRYMVVTGSLN